MLTAGIELLHINQMASFFIFDMQVKQHCDNEQIAQGDFQYTVSVNCVDKRSVCFSSSR